MTTPSRAARALALLAAATLLILASSGGAARAEDAPQPQGQPQEQSPWFREVARERGLPAELFAHRCCFVDVDGDTWPDVMLANRRLFRNVPAPGGGRRFVEVPDALGIAPDAPTPALTLFADLDQDGDQDALVIWADDPSDPKRKAPAPRARVHWQTGPLRFQPDLRPLPLEPEPVVAGGLFDRDHDGRLDLVLGSTYKAGGAELEAYPVRLLAGGPRGSFREVTREAGLALRPEPGRLDSRRPIFGVAFADLDGDGRAEVLLCAYGRQRNLLYLNQGDGTFREVGTETGFAGDQDESGTYSKEIKEMFRRRYGQERPDELPFRANGNTFDAPAADVDNDGRVDVFLGEITHAWAGPSSDRSSLLWNEGPPLRFRRDEAVCARQHVTPSWNQGDLFAGFADVDNDGWQDLIVASGEYPDDNRARLFRQDRPGHFVDVTGPAGLAWDNCTALSLADYDKDGDVDILVGNSNNRLPAERRQGRVLRPALFENQVGSQRRWLNVRLVGAGAARGGASPEAYGARVTVWAGGRRYLREVVGARGHAGHVDAREAAFGLGAATKVDRLEVLWPSRELRRTVLEDVPVDRCLVLRQGEKE
ncbi:MAG: CRTAC1 family protein [Planctomycetota bacterium]